MPPIGVIVVVAKSGEAKRPATIVEIRLEPSRVYRRVPRYHGARGCFHGEQGRRIPWMNDRGLVAESMTIPGITAIRCVLDDSLVRTDSDSAIGCHHCTADNIDRGRRWKLTV